MQRRITDARNRHIDKIVAQAPEAAGTQLSINTDQFIRSYYRNVSVEDLMYADDEEDERPMKQISFSAEQCLYETVREVTQEKWNAMSR